MTWEIARSAIETGAVRFIRGLGPLPPAVEVHMCPLTEHSIRSTYTLNETSEDIVKGMNMDIMATT